MRYAKLYILNALAFFFATTMAVAQPIIPGFQGKRFFVEPTVSLFPSLIGATSSSSAMFKGSTNNNYTRSGFSANSGQLSIAWRGGVGVHYITGRHSNMFLRYEYLPTGVDVIVRTPLPFEITNSSDFDFDEHALFLALDTHILSFGMEFSPKTMLAPIGPYTRLSLQYLMYNGTVKDKVSYYLDKPERTQTEHLPIGLDNVSGTDYGLGLDFGYRSVIAKKILFNWAVCTNLNFGIFKIDTSTIRSSSASLTSDYLAQNALRGQDAAARRIAAHWLTF